MDPLLTAIKTSPGIVSTLASAVLSASVALIVLAVTQLFQRRSANMQFFAPKLQDLYLLLNEVADQHTTLFADFMRKNSGDAEASSRLVALNDLDLYGHRHAKKIIMYVRLYFPYLTEAHIRLFNAQRELNNLKFRAFGPEPPSTEEFLVASGHVSHCIKLMEQEMVRNRDVLLGQSSLLRRYRRSSRHEIENEEPPPTAAMFVSA